MSDPASAPADAPLIAAMRQLQAALERVDRDTASRLGLARSDGKCLMMLMDGPLSPRAIGERLGLASGSVTALLDRLERRAFITREPDPADRRGIVVSVTPLAAAQLREVHAPLSAALEKLAARYGPERAGAAAQQIGDVARVAQWAAARIAQGGGAG